MVAGSPVAKPGNLIPCAFIRSRPNLPHTRSVVSLMAEPLPHSRPRLLGTFPLLALVLIAYNVASMLGYSFTNPAPERDIVLKVHLISGAEWTLIWTDILLLSGLL